MFKKLLRNTCVAIGALVIGGAILALANYAVTVGAGINFGSIVVSAVHYAQQLLCDPTTPSQCIAVSAGGSASVNVTNANANGQATMANSSPVVIASNQASFPVAATLGAETTKVIGTVNQGTSPWVVSNSGTFAVQATLQASATTAIGKIDPNTAANWGLGATAAAVPANAQYMGGIAITTEPAAGTAGNLTGLYMDLTGKAITSPYASRANMVRGAASTTGTGATTVLAASGSASLKTYVTDIECGRTDAGTTAIFLTFNDVGGTGSGTIFVLPDNGGGGGNNKNFEIPLVTAANTAFTFTASSSITTVYCNAQGFTGY